MSGLTLDAGALLALERGDERVRALLYLAIGRGLTLAAPAGVVAQAWRGGPRQARVARLLADPLVEIPALDGVTARAIGVLCGRTGHPDVVDVHVALHARQFSQRVVTSDPRDIHRVDPTLRLIPI